MSKHPKYYYSKIRKTMVIESKKDVQFTGTYYNKMSFCFEMYGFNRDTLECIFLGAIAERIARERPQFAKDGEDRIWKAFLSSSPWPLVAERTSVPFLIEEETSIPSFKTFQDSCVKTSQGYTAPTREGYVVLGKILYNCLGLAGEAGELLEHVKKSLRTHPAGLCSQAETDAVLFELGDVLYYVSEIATLMGWSLDHVAGVNITRREKRWLDDAAD